ncbi:MAG TPA: GNAT family N-acetyltransferase [Abditibacteriaceae bacterium]|jgi:GNAT superfamily N-acetyltransferase
MHHDLCEITLKSGEHVQATVVHAPDMNWRERITNLLAHKDEIWRWQVAHLLSDSTGSGVETRFYLLHRDGLPFSNVMTVEFAGVGLLGHVWTSPNHRQQGAASALMSQALHHFKERGGKALYLETGFDSPPFHLYRKLGFEPFDPNSGIMQLSTTTMPQFEAAYFAPGETQVVPFAWPQWAVASALFTGDFPGVVRSAPFKLLGRSLIEEALLPVVRQQLTRTAGTSSHALVLQKTDNGAVVGFAAWSFDPLWPGTCLVDVWCHPHFWSRAEELLRSLALPAVRRVVALTDAHCPEKASTLQASRFRPVATLPQWAAANAAYSQWVDVTVWERA